MRVEKRFDEIKEYTKQDLTKIRIARIIATIDDMSEVLSIQRQNLQIILSKEMASGHALGELESRIALSIMAVKESQAFLD
jgi:hypothetical protein